MSMPRQRNTANMHASGKLHADPSTPKHSREAPFTCVLQELLRGVQQEGRLCLPPPLSRVQRFTIVAGARFLLGDERVQAVGGHHELEGQVGVRLGLLKPPHAITMFNLEKYGKRR